MKRKLFVAVCLALAFGALQSVDRWDVWLYQHSRIVALNGENFWLSGKVFASTYNTAPPIPLLAGQTQVVWNAETPTPGNGTTAASQQVVLNTGGFGGNTPFSVDGHFSGAPGVFEVDVQVASNDSDTDYQTCSNCNITTVDSTNNTFHLDAGQAVARYVRLLMRSRTNSVSITARINR